MSASERDIYEVLDELLERVDKLEKARKPARKTKKK